MTDPPRRQYPLSEQDIEQGERYAGPHDPGPGEQYAGQPVADPWDTDREEDADGELDPGSVPGEPAQ
jgi:hypothetical protein